MGTPADTLAAFMAVSNETSSNRQTTILRFSLLVLSGLIASCTGSNDFDVEAACDNADGSAEVRAAQSYSSIDGVVAVFVHSPDRWYFCSGVLVGPQTVLTAAHCVHDRDDWAIDVYFTPDLLYGGPSISVGSRREHPTQDLAALFLDETGPADMQPLRWSGDQLGSQHIERLSVTGYGGPEGDVSRCLRITEMVQDIVIDSSTTTPWTRYAVLLDGQVYPGDSGGPLVLDDNDGPILLGILSETTGWDAPHGSLLYFERLRQDDPWVIEAIPTSPIQIP